MTDAVVFTVLSDLLRPYADGMIIKSDTDSNFYLNETQSSAKPQMFGAVQIKKNYTSFHLFPVYTHPEFLDNLSPDLRKRMQGKSCFNFKAAEQIPVPELQDLVKRSYESLSKA